MTLCEHCIHALWDYETYYGTTDKQWFVYGCKQGLDESEECEGYEEWRGEG